MSAGMQQEEGAQASPRDGGAVPWSGWDGASGDPLCSPQPGAEGTGQRGSELAFDRLRHKAKLRDYVLRFLLGAAFAAVTLPAGWGDCPQPHRARSCHGSGLQPLWNHDVSRGTLRAGDLGTRGKRNHCVSPTCVNTDRQLPGTWCHQGHHLSLTQVQPRVKCSTGLGRAPGLWAPCHQVSGWPEWHW